MLNPHFRRGDFPVVGDQTLASKEASYNFGGAGRAKNNRATKAINRAKAMPLILE